MGERANQGQRWAGVGAQSVAHPNNSIYPLRVQNFWASTVKRGAGQVQLQQQEAKWNRKEIFRQDKQPIANGDVASNVSLLSSRAGEDGSAVCQRVQGSSAGARPRAAVAGGADSEPP